MYLDVLTMFNNWIPESSIWQAWGKPVAFTAMRALPLRQIEQVQIDRGMSIMGIPQVREQTALVIDLDPARTVKLAARLALENYQPVPLFNAVPSPDVKTRAAVQLDPLIEALAAFADDMAEIRVDDDAPPAFMLSNNRKGGRVDPKPGEFDNRWLVFAQDFPSGRYLLDNGITGALVIQDSRSAPAEDLLHVLHGWQKAGVELLQLAYGQDDRPRPIEVSKPLGFNTLWRRTLVMMGLRRNAAGGFGSIVPTPAEGGGYS